MSSITIFYSIFGNNKRIATDLAEKKDSNLIEFAPGSILRVFSFFIGKKRLEKKAKEIDITAYNHIDICGPIWARKPAPAVIKLLENLDLDGKSINCHFTFSQDYAETESLVKELVKGKGGDLIEINFTKIKEDNQQLQKIFNNEE